MLVISGRSSLNGVGWLCVSACAKNLVGGVENALGGTLTDGLASAPRLDIAPAIFRARQPKRFAAKQRHGFGFYLANISGCGFGVGKVALIAMAKGNVSQLMEKGFAWLHGNRADGDLPATLGVTLGVAIQVLKGDSLDFQRGKCRLLVPFGNRGSAGIRPLPSAPRQTSWPCR